MNRVRVLIGRTLVFKTSRLPKKIGVPVRRIGRKILFGHKRPTSTIIGL